MSDTILTKKQLSHFKAKCRAYANVMLRRGKIERLICAVCGSDEAEMHHTDYTKPLQVHWLCRQCHVDIHKAVKADRAFMAAFSDAFDLANT